MTSFLSDGEKKALSEQFNDLHDTFAREIFVYKEAKKIVVSTDPGYNYIYNETSAAETSIKNVPQKISMMARI